MNLYAQGLLDTPFGFAAALLVGLAFGFWLERAGFGSSRRMADFFYLRDFTVLRVMFTALVTAAIGLWAFDALGFLAIEDLYRMETRFGPALVGGALFGAGFAIGGWCPGTALVGAASARIDALAFLFGGVAGSLVYAALWPVVGSFQEVGACGVTTLPETLGFSAATITWTVAFMATGLFALTHLYERRHAARKETIS